LALIVSASLTAAFSDGGAFEPPIGSEDDGVRAATFERQNRGGGGAAAFPAHIVTLLTSDRSGGDLIGGWSWTVSQDPDAGGWSAKIIGEVEGNSLLAEHESDTVPVALYGYILSSTGELIAHVHQQHNLPLASHETRLRDTGLRVVQSLRLTSSPVSVRLAVANLETTRFLVATLDLTEPIAGAAPPALLPPLVHDAADAWLVVTPDGEQPAAGRVTLGERSYVPATRMVAANGHPTEMVLVTTSRRPTMTVVARFVDTNGVTRAQPHVGVGDDLNTEGTAPSMFRASIEPVDLPPDLYLLELALGDPDLAARVFQTLPIAVTEKPPNVVWTAAGIAAAEANRVDPSQLEAQNIGSIGAQTAALLLSGQRGGEVVGSLIWSVNPTGSKVGMAEVPIFVEVEGASLLTDQSGPELNLGVFAYVFSSEGALVGHLAQGLTLDLRSYGEQLRDSGLKFVGKFELPSGSHLLHLLVRNQDTGRLALKIARIDVPDGNRDQPVILPPVFPDPDGSWVVARQHGLDADAIGLALGQTLVTPAARAVVEGGRPTDMFIGVANWNEGTPITARVIDIQGRHLAEPLLTVGDETGVAHNGIRFFRATLGGLDLPAGWYMLELTLEDASSGARRSRSIPIAVIVNRRPTVWASLSKTAPTDRHIAHPTVPGPRTAPPSNGEMGTVYVAALRALADGDRSSAREQIAILERSVAAAGSNSASSSLYRAQLRVARELAETGPEALVPIVLVHREMFRHYLASGEDRLADHAWRLATALAEEVPQDWRQEGGSAFPETVLVAIAADLVRSGLTSSAIELLERAVKLAPRDPAALLALGATYERSGSYSEAVSPLRTLVQEHPNSAEGRLRLAINLARTGKQNEAAYHFRQLTTDRSAAWVEVISYQELARLVPTDAEELLRTGLARFPSDQALRIQLAHLLDARGRPWEASMLIEELASSAAPPETSPRVRYPAWPSMGLERRMAAFERAAGASTSALATAIQVRASGTEAS
jgi:tetratricopeptide (TPR) repeat protein